MRAGEEGAAHDDGHDGAERADTKEEEPDFMEAWALQEPNYGPWDSAAGTEAELHDGPGAEESGGPDASDGMATVIPAGGMAARPGPKPPWRGGTWNAWGNKGRGRGRGKGKAKGKPYRGNRGGRGRNEPKSKGKGKGNKRWQGDDEEDCWDDHGSAPASHLAHLFT